MTIRWRLSKRILIASILSGLVGLLTARVLTRFVLEKTLAQAFAPISKLAYDSGERARCEAAPERWSLTLDARGTSFAYDALTLTSRNPAAPPLDIELLRKLREQPDLTAIMHLETLASTGVFIFGGANEGPCAIIQTRFAKWSGLMPSNLALLGPVVVIIAATLVALGLVILPLARRIETLRVTAERVGDTERYVPAGLAGGDDLGALSTSLDRAHHRIAGDARRLADRQRELERALSDVAHDLKTPIASLQLTLEQAADACSEPGVAELLTSALNDAVYLGALTENLRMATQLREGWDPQAGDPTVELGEIAERVAARARILARRRGITVDVARPDTAVLARCNPVAAERALGNVVDNAVAYGSRGGHVALILEANGTGFALSVTDDGPGVASAEIPRLGDRAFRSDEARARDPKGSGLGLAITAEIAARCGWRLAFLPQEPRGLSVRIEGPRRD